LFITLTGVDGSGKSTLAPGLAALVRDQFGPCLVAESKDDFVVTICQTVGEGADPRSFFGAYAFDFAKAFDAVRDHFVRVEPHLAQGTSVVVPRSADCRLGIAATHHNDNLQNIEKILGVIPAPDLTLRLKVDSLVAAQRVLERGIDEEEADHLARFSGALDELGKRRNWIEIDASGSPGSILQAAKGALMPLFQAASSRSRITSS
jgi:thymidylate kinase